MLTTLSKRSLTNRVAAMASAAVLGAGVVGGAAYALTSGSAPANAGPGGSVPAVGAAVPAPAGAASSAPAPGGAPTLTAKSTHPARVAGALRFLRRAVHAEIEVRAAGGGLKTVDLDRGTISALSSTSITIAPEDGGSPITASITSSTHEPKQAALSQGKTVLLVSSQGKALAIRPARPLSP